MHLIIVSGVSGSGKSIALNVLEDLDYYCIDNLPLWLLPELALHSTDRLLSDRLAVGIDVRNQTRDLTQFNNVLHTLKKSSLHTDVLFLDAEDGILIKRFSETRRKHPLSDANTSLADAIRRERSLLDPIRTNADLYVDTSLTNIHQLRDLMLKHFAETRKQGLSILVQSFGFKHGIPKDADFVFDVRCLPNPHWDPSLRNYTGLDAEVACFLEQKDDVKRMLVDIGRFVKSWIPDFEREKRSYLTIAIGCTGGQHRSVYLADALFKDLTASGILNVIIRHRELP